MDPAYPQPNEAAERVPPARPRVLLVGASDVDKRLELMSRLRDEFDLAALGSSPALAERFSAQGFDYDSYHLGARQVSPLGDLRTIADLVRIFRSRRPDIVHAFDTRPGVWGCLAAHLAGVPAAIGTMTGLSFLYGSQRLSTRLVWSVYRRLQALACRYSDATVFQNREDARYFVAEGIVSSQKARVILGSGVPTEALSPERVSSDQRRKVREELGIEEGEIVVTMISRVIRSKGVMDFAAAARALCAERDDVRFLLIGPRDTDSLDRLTEAEVRELEQSLSWPGARQDVQAILAVSDVAALPTAYREGLPRVLLEAGSMGLPIVATDSPGCNEVVEDGVNGFLTPVGDGVALTRALRRLIEDSELRSKLGSQSRKRVQEHFDLSVIATQTRQLYRELLQRGVPR